MRPTSDYARVEHAIDFLRSRTSAPPSLAEVAAEVGLSEFHFQRLFQRWAGVSPKRFLQFLTLERAKALLQETRSLLDASVELGLSGPSRLHDLFLSLEHLTPGQYSTGARGMTVRWAVEHTPLGPALFSTLEGRLCGLAFLAQGDAGEAREELAARWPGATWEESTAAARPHVLALRERLAGELNRPLALLLKGTPLQFRVWEALLRVPAGGVITYGGLAQMVGEPRAARAVGTAVGANPIAFLIPCHRVIRSTGTWGDYRWGAARKTALLGLEQSQLAAP